MVRALAVELRNSLHTRALHPDFGIELGGITCLQNLDVEACARISAAVDQHSVVLIRGLTLDTKTQISFSARFGELEFNHILYGQERRKEFFYRIGNINDEGKQLPSSNKHVRFSTGNEMWHSDSSFRPIPAMFSISFAHEVSAEGGELEFVSTRRPYDELPGTLKDELDDLVVLQMLTGGRRAVVVCDHGKWHGSGKSTVLDAVHRAFVLNTGGVCVAVRLRMLGAGGLAGGEPCAGGDWIEKTGAAVRLALRECREQWWPAAGACDGPRPAATSQPGGGTPAAATRRRRASRGSKTPGRRGAVSRGFHPLSEMGAEAREAALEELVGDMAALAELAEARCRHHPSSSSKILWIM
ncbi:unnamed protein product, partial [Prorocentrum cordatum]